MEKGITKFQYSQFDALDGQYVVRTDDEKEFKELVAKVHLATGNIAKPIASVKQNSAITGDKPKVPYMWEGDTCPVCHKGVLMKGINKTREGKTYDALMCDQNGCYGKAYISKYPKPNQDNYPQEEQNNDIPF